MALLFLLSALPAAALEPLAPAQCRCTDVTAACFKSIPFAALNASVGGRLVAVEDEFGACLKHGLASRACSADLNRTDEEFFYTGQVGGYMHTGLASGAGQQGWSIAHTLSSFAVEAETEADVAAGVAFAARHNMRVAVKGTGHDWFGRSGSHPDLEGSLLIWTHRLKKMTWHDDEPAAAGFVAAGCAPGSAVPHALTVQAGIQFADMYPAAEKRGRLVNGGTCTSVGVGGCTLGGCFGPFSQKLGPSASNVLQAKVVLANGTLVTASKCSHPDLFWALRGGGSGHGVVTEWTYRTYTTPDFLAELIYSGSVGSGKAADILATAVEVLRAADKGFLSAGQGWNGDITLPVSAKASGFSIKLNTYEGNVSAALPLFDALDAWVKAQPAAMKLKGRVSSTRTRKPASGTWVRAGAPEGQVYLPWDDTHHDTEIGTEHLLSLSKWMTRTALHEGPGDTGLRKMAVAIANISAASCAGVLSGSLCRRQQGMGMHKSQGNASPLAKKLFLETSQNPVLLDTVGFLTSQWRVPALPQLPPSSGSLRPIWPRLAKYAGIQDDKPLMALCAAGAAGAEDKATQCLAQWGVKRDAIVAQLQVVRRTVNWHFPTADGAYAGSYWNEADYNEPHWQSAFFGKSYPRLLQVKNKYDPHGFFTCHHCVGSELMSDNGNCKKQ